MAKPWNQAGEEKQPFSMGAPTHPIMCLVCGRSMADFLSFFVSSNFQFSKDRTRIRSKVVLHSRSHGSGERQGLVTCCAGPLQKSIRIHHKISAQLYFVLVTSQDVPLPLYSCGPHSTVRVCYPLETCRGRVREHDALGVQKPCSMFSQMNYWLHKPPLHAAPFTSVPGSRIPSPFLQLSIKRAGSPGVGLALVNRGVK
jgi:hypothetical protein